MAKRAHVAGIFVSCMSSVPRAFVPKLATLKVTVSRLDKACVKLKRNKQQYNLELLMDESGLVNCTEEKRDCPCTVMNPVVTKSSTYELHVETLHKVNMDLAGELKKSEAALNDEKLKTDELSAKLSKLSIRNVNKKLKEEITRSKKANAAWTT